MKVLLDSLHWNVHTQEFYPNKLQRHKIKSKPISGSERVKQAQWLSLYCSFGNRHFFQWNHFKDGGIWVYHKLQNRMENHPKLQRNLIKT